MELERDVERYLTDRCKKAGLLTFKFTSPSNAGVPDRIILASGGKVVFVEVKRPGGKLRKLQKLRLWQLHANGHLTEVIDSKQGVDELIGGLSDVSWKTA